jgi:uncharacterized membrane protein
MNLTKRSNQNSDSAALATEQFTLKKKGTRGQRLADAMASKVGSWAFIGAQSAILAGWIGANTMPGVPHWDESPFIMLNLVFSFASAYTAPVVLMSQNRQSEEDRENAEINHKVNLQAAQNIELLHEKISELQVAKSWHPQTQQLAELVELLQQQQTAYAAKVTQAPAQSYLDQESLPQSQPTPATVLLSQPILNPAHSAYVSDFPSHLQTKHKFVNALSDEQRANSAKAGSVSAK